MKLFICQRTRRPRNLLKDSVFSGKVAAERSAIDTTTAQYGDEPALESDIFLSANGEDDVLKTFCAVSDETVRSFIIS